MNDNESSCPRDIRSTQKRNFADTEDEELEQTHRLLKSDAEWFETAFPRRSGGVRSNSPSFSCHHLVFLPHVQICHQILAAKSPVPTEGWGSVHVAAAQDSHVTRYDVRGRNCMRRGCVRRGHRCFTPPTRRSRGTTARTRSSRSSARTFFQPRSPYSRTPEFRVLEMSQKCGKLGFIQ
jgi:hypothetical protein